MFFFGPHYFICGIPEARIATRTHTVFPGQGTREVTATVIGSIVCSEIPDPAEDPFGYALVSQFMMHWHMWRP